MIMHRTASGMYEHRAEELLPRSVFVRRLLGDKLESAEQTLEATKDPLKHE